ncbi:MAG: quinone-dependent dihydroorotate dehydrogenase [Lentisphaeria bacterium]|nr:quinone-dependent dihydroorotate dehydrogenase [Lentisphaeria bacterium]
MYRLFIRPILFLFKAETIHNAVFFLMGIPGMKCMLSFLFNFQDPRLERKIAGLTFRNPVGLAAGLDKNAKRIDQFAAMGFGFIEIGTITPVAQAGNDKPRLFRIIPDEAVINRMGFNNDGMTIAVERLKSRKSTVLVGGNIGKNKVTPNEESISDYEKTFHALYDYVDYFVVNVSSPNTPNLRELQDKEPLTKLLSHLQKLNQEKADKPLFLKIAPDLTDSQLDDIVEIIRETKLTGIIATNTTISRDGLSADPKMVESIGAGGLSGKPLTNRATEVIRYIHDKSNGDFVIIGVGGIHSAADAIEKLKAGASLLQIYSGFIYHGPDLIKEINKAILKENL